MRHVAALLLLLLVPGLVLPAGVWLHACRCEVAAPVRHGCCQARPSAPLPMRSCCAHGKHRNDNPPATPAPSAATDDCGCTWVPLPTPEPSKTPPAPPTAPLALPIAVPTGLPPCPRRHCPPVVPPANLRSPPPPGTDRNLPLRL